MANLKSIIEESFTQYAGAVLQSRALVDVRDFLKPSARQIFYSMYLNKLVHSKPFKKTNNAIGRAMADYYIHGDSSCEGIIMRAGQPFAMRYPLVEVQGSFGNLMESGNWAAPRYCLTGDAFISTDKGLLKMKDVVDSKENSDNEIPTLTCRGVFSNTTTNLFFNSGLQQTHRLTLKNGLQISGTPNHPILTLNENFDLVWKTIEELNVGDKILLNGKDDFLYGEENDIEYAKALGCLVSEGCLTKKDTIDMINSDLDMIMPVYELLRSYGSKAEYHKRTQKDGCYYVTTTNQKLYERLEKDNCIHDSYNKHIPDSIFKGTREYQVAFLRYLFEGDGCITLHSGRYGRISYSSVSEELIRELQILLLSNFGIMSSISKQKNRKEIKLELGGEDVYLFEKNIGFVSERKRNLLKRAVTFYTESRNKKSTGSRGWRIFPEIKNFLLNYYPETNLIVKRNNRPNECRGPLMSKNGLKILKNNLPDEIYDKIAYIYKNFISIPIVKKEDSGLQVVYSPKINEKCNSYTANGIINHNTEARLSAVSDKLFEDIAKNTISDWRDNYDDTKQYPSVLTSKGFYNIVNGTVGIGIGASSSVPAFNLTEVNNALIKLLRNPDIDFEDIYCAPDFPTGAILLNEESVKESLKNGTGDACKLRSVISFDSSDRCLIVTEIPYGVYTNTICGELEELLNSDDNPGIDRFNDLTGKDPLIKIYLKRSANPEKVLKSLYKNTSLQSYYAINMTMLENGRFPKVFTWKEALQSFIDHQKIVYTKGFEYDLNKIAARLHIIAGLLAAIEKIDEVIRTIKESGSTAEANKQLQILLSIDEVQANAILDIKLAKLAKLEVGKLHNEKTDLEAKELRLKSILSDENLLKDEIAKDLQKTIDNFGDERRTKIMNLSAKDDEEIENRQLSMSFTNFGGVFVTETSTLIRQNRGAVGKKVKLQSGENIISNVVCDSIDTILIFSNKGNCYACKANEFLVGEKTWINSITPIKDGEKISAVTALSKNDCKEHIIFITKNGLIKKTLLSEYNTTRSTGVRAIALDEDDEVRSIIFTNSEPIGILTKLGHFLLIPTKDIRAIGRVTRGVKGITLSDCDEVISAKSIPKDFTEIVSISSNGLSKRTDAEEFTWNSRGAKGGKLQKLQDGETMVDFLPIKNEKDILIISSNSSLKVSVDTISNQSKGCQGVKTIKLPENKKIIGINRL